MTDPYEDQLKAARYKAERDQARQELSAERFRRRRTGETVWRLQNRLSRAHRRERQLRKGLRMWRNKAIEMHQATMRPYELLTEEDRETLRWVRKHGGVENLSKRLMPEGMEWLLEVWPRWSNGEYCKFGDWWKSEEYGERKPQRLKKLAIYSPEQLREWRQDDGDNFGYEWDFMRPRDPKHRPDKAEPPDTYAKLYEDVHDERCGSEEFVRRCKALSERGE